eukprot:6207260-Pleurochrysis_carterae.AAC.3
MREERGDGAGGWGRVDCRVQAAPPPGCAETQYWLGHRLCGAERCERREKASARLPKNTIFCDQVRRAPLVKLTHAGVRAS